MNIDIPRGCRVFSREFLQQGNLDDVKKNLEKTIFRSIDAENLDEIKLRIADFNSLSEKMDYVETVFAKAITASSIAIEAISQSVVNVNRETELRKHVLRIEMKINTWAAHNDRYYYSFPELKGREKLHFKIPRNFFFAQGAYEDNNQVDIDDLFAVHIGFEITPQNKPAWNSAINKLQKEFPFEMKNDLIDFTNAPGYLLPILHSVLKDKEFYSITNFTHFLERFSVKGKPSAQSISSRSKSGSKKIEKIIRGIFTVL